MYTICETPGCGNVAGEILGADLGYEEECRACQSIRMQGRRARRQRAKYELLAPRRNTSELLMTIRDGLLSKQIIGMIAGTPESALQRYIEIMRRATLRMILTGTPFGFVPIFTMLESAWTTSKKPRLDCLDKVFDFVIPPRSKQITSWTQQHMLRLDARKLEQINKRQRANRWRKKNLGLPHK